VSHVLHYAPGHSRSATESVRMFTVNSFMKRYMCNEPVSGFSTMDGERLSTCCYSKLHITHFAFEDVEIYSSKMLATHPASTEGQKET